MKIILSLIFVFSATYTLASEKINTKLDNRIVLEWQKQFHQSAKKIVSIYNKNLSKDHNFFKQRTKHLKLKKNYQGTLPRAFYTDGKIIIPDIKFSFDFQDSIHQKFQLDGFSYRLTCSRDQSCINSLVESLLLRQKASSTFTFGLINEAYASESIEDMQERINNLIDQSTLRIMAALLHLQKASGGAKILNLSWFDNEQEKEEKAIANLNLIQSQMNKVLKECRDHDDNYESHRSQDFSYRVNSAYEMKKLVSTIAHSALEFEDIDDQIDPALYYKINSSLSNRDKAHLKCDQAYQLATPKTRANKSNELIQAEKDLEHYQDSLSGFMSAMVRADTEREIVTLKARIAKLSKITNPTYAKAKQDFCDSMKSLKSCMQRYISQGKGSYHIYGSQLEKDIREMNDKIKPVESQVLPE